MSGEIRLKTPLTERQVRGLRAKQPVYLDGIIYCVSGIDAHKRLIEYSEKHREIPIDLKDSVIIHAPAFCQEVDDAWKLTYLTVTTSARMNLYEPELIQRFSIRGIIGKGGMDEKTHETMKKVGSVYFAQVGGCNAYYLLKVDKRCDVFWKEFFPFALVELKVHDYGPLIVAMDTYGNNLYGKALEKGQKVVNELLGQ